MKAGSIFFDCFNGIDDKMFESYATHADTPKGITAEQFRKLWQVSNEVAHQTLDVTTQLKNQDADSTLSCLFGMNDCMLRYKILYYLFYTDTFYNKQVVSKLVFSMMQLFVSDKGFVKVYRIKYEKEFVKYLKLFYKEVGSPKAFIVYPHKSQKSNGVRAFLKKVGTTLQALEESTQKSDRAEVLYQLFLRMLVLHCFSEMYGDTQ